MKVWSLRGIKVLLLFIIVFNFAGIFWLLHPKYFKGIQRYSQQRKKLKSPPVKKSTPAPSFAPTVLKSVNPRTANREWNKSTSELRITYEDPSCDAPVKSVAFIKTHKTGSTTLAHILNRFGYQRNLSFVLHNNRTNGHIVYSPITKNSPKEQFLKPLYVTKGHYRKYKYDMITVHIKYNRPVMDKFMKPDTRYITLLRDPATQFESSFVHFQFDDAFPRKVKEKLKNLKIDERLREWFRNATDYRDKLKKLKWEGEKGLRYFYAQNNQIFDLGLDTEYHTNDTLVEAYISKIEKEFDLVLITEYFEESLLVMKKQFCWDLEDILFISKNQRSEKAKNYTVSVLMRQQMREWNSVDYKLYQHFNSTLWKKVKDYGKHFEEDLENFREKLKEVFANCTSGFYFIARGHHWQNVNYRPLRKSGQFCKLIAEHKRTLAIQVRERQLKEA
ncbi:Galactose-3-O-sulfotransferase 3 [Holothuria leucospilota]|uniref:Galactose-3-O-sulfotransferase 3 n=1 Tax=Holothuria leucospilota TaxID=206669 RepID=A0A9Q1CPW9_HOLLE|nr:Galactose-3-O-sulfotransferase 3 [Holothuria leucospilota]